MTNLSFFGRRLASEDAGSTGSRFAANALTTASDLAHRAAHPSWPRRWRTCRGPPRRRPSSPPPPSPRAFRRRGRRGGIEASSGGLSATIAAAAAASASTALGAPRTGSASPPPPPWPPRQVRRVTFRSGSEPDRTRGVPRGARPRLREREARPDAFARHLRVGAFCLRGFPGARPRSRHRGTAGTAPTEAEPRPGPELARETRGGGSRARDVAVREPGASNRPPRRAGGAAAEGRAELLLEFRFFLRRSRRRRSTSSMSESVSESHPSPCTSSVPPSPFVSTAPAFGSLDPAARGRTRPSRRPGSPARCTSKSSRNLS